MVALSARASPSRPPAHQPRVTRSRSGGGGRAWWSPRECRALGGRELPHSLLRDSGAVVGVRYGCRCAEEQRAVRQRRVTRRCAPPAPPGRPWAAGSFVVTVGSSGRRALPGTLVESVPTRTDRPRKFTSCLRSARSSPSRRPSPAARGPGRGAAGEVGVDAFGGAGRSVGCGLGGGREHARAGLVALGAAVLRVHVEPGAVLGGGEGDAHGQTRRARGVAATASGVCAESRLVTIAESPRSGSSGSPVTRVAPVNVDQAVGAMISRTTPSMSTPARVGRRTRPLRRPCVGCRRR